MAEAQTQSPPSSSLRELPFYTELNTDPDSAEMATVDSLTDPATFCQVTVPNATIYSPLEPGQIRVLHLQPAQKVKAPLVGVFEVIQVGSDAEYEALSYTWGQAFEEPMASKLRDAVSSQKRKFLAYQFEPGEIWIHEVMVPTTANFHVALRRLRYPDKARSLWVDAICINQDDLAERSAQVACMSQIFSGASQVVVWIAEDSLVEDEQFDLLRVFEDRRYFPRRWCIQEVAFAKSAILKCGDREIPWSTLIAVIAGQKSFYLDGIQTLAEIAKERHTIRMMT